MRRGRRGLEVLFEVDSVLKWRCADLARLSARGASSRDHRTDLETIRERAQVGLRKLRADGQDTSLLPLYSTRSRRGSDGC